MAFFQRTKIAVWTLLHIIAIKTFLCAVGLESLSSARHFKRSNTRPEVGKPVIRKSFLLALCKCGVHFLPVAASITILYINIKGYWIGAQTIGVHEENNVSIALFFHHGKHLQRYWSHNVGLLSEKSVIIQSNVRLEQPWSFGDNLH